MTRSIHILLALLLAIAPVAPLWAVAGEPCEMSAMHDHDATPQAPCERCADCCDEVECAPSCQALGASPMVLGAMSSVQDSPDRDVFSPTATDQVPAGHSSPALRPPISR